MVLWEFLKIALILAFWAFALVAGYYDQRERYGRAVLYMLIAMGFLAGACWITITGPSN